MALWQDVGTRYIQETYSPGQGLDAFRSPLMVEPSFCADMQDFSSRQFPALRSREGRTPIFKPLASWSIHKVHVNPVGVVHIIFSDGVGYGNNWAYWNSTTGAWEIIESELVVGVGGHFFPYDLADFYDYTTNSWFTYIIKTTALGQPTLTYWNNTAVARIPYATFSPVLGPVCSHMNRLFAPVNNSLGNLAWSNLNVPLTWETLSVIPVGSSENIITMKSLSDRLFIGTNKGVYVMFGDSEENFTVQNITRDTSVGNGYLACTAHNSVYFSDGYDVYEYRNGTIRNITHADSTNGVAGGLPLSPRSSVGATANARIQSMGASDYRLYVCTTSKNATNTRNLWWVFDFDHRRWHIEVGQYVNSEPQSSVFAHTPNGRVISTDLSETSGTFWRYPRLIELESGLEYDARNQCNYLLDTDMTDVSKWTAIAGADSFATNYKVTGNGTAAVIGTTQTVSGIGYYVTNYVYARIEVRVTDAVCQKLELKVGATSIALQNTPTINTWYTLKGMVTVAASTDTFNVYATYADAATANGKVVEMRYALLDYASFSFGFAEEPQNATEYEYDLPASGWFAFTNPTTHWVDSVSCSYTSPHFVIRPSAKKTLANVWVTIETSPSVEVHDTTRNLTIKYSGDGTNYITAFVETASAVGRRVIHAKVPIKSYTGTYKYQNQDWIQLMITCTGPVSITGITLDWRVRERTR